MYARARVRMRVRMCVRMCVRGGVNEQKAKNRSKKIFLKKLQKYLWCKNKCLPLQQLNNLTT